MVTEKNAWISVRQAHERHHVPRRTLYGFIERKSVKTKEARGKTHVLESDLLAVLAERAAKTSAAQTSLPIRGSAGAQGPEESAIHVGRRQLEEKKLAARAAEADADLRRAQDALATADAERQARVEEARLAAERHRLELDRSRFEFEQAQREKADEAQFEQARRLAQLNEAKEKRAHALVRERWLFQWLRETTAYATKFLGPRHTEHARAIARGVLLDFDSSTPPEMVSEEILNAIWRQFEDYEDLLIDDYVER